MLLSVGTGAFHSVIINRLWEHVNEILQAQLGDMFPEGGVEKKCTNLFIEKHSHHLKTLWSTPLESKCGHAVNKNALNAFYNLLDDLIKEYHLIPRNMYGTDEVRTNLANGEREWVIGWNRSGPQYQQQSGNHENITIIVTNTTDM
jgi:hypothetical protein